MTFCGNGEIIKFSELVLIYKSVLTLNLLLFAATYENLAHPCRQEKQQQLEEASIKRIQKN